MMGYFGVDAPLCSYVYITVNGEDWGLYLAVEGVEESFLERNYGSGYGELYKPDSMSMGGGMMGSDDLSLIYTDDNYDSYHEQLHGRRYGRSHGAGRSGQPVRRAGDTVTACAIPGEDTAPAVSAAAANTAGWRPTGGRNASDAA